MTTERAVAGVRGTIFRVDYASTAKGATPMPKPSMVVRVVKGRVVVQVPQAGPKPPPPASDTKNAPRVQVAGP